MDPDNPPPPPELRFLKLLVTTLTGVMIVGLVTIVALLVIRLGPAPALPALPENIALPDGVQMQALTIARDWVVVVSEDGEVLLYERRSGELRQRVGVE